MHPYPLIPKKKKLIYKFHQKYINYFAFPKLYSYKLIRIFLYILPVLIILGVATIFVLDYVFFEKECDKLYFTEEDNAEIPNSLIKYENCTEKRLCDISVYGGCPGTCYDIFSIGITLLAILASFVLEFRANIWGKLIFQIQENQLVYPKDVIKMEGSKRIHSDSSLEKKEQKVKKIQKNDIKRRNHLDRYLLWDKIIYMIAVISLVPMCWINWFDSVLHAIFAAISFFFFIVYMVIDTRLYYLINGYLKLRKRSKYVTFYNLFLVVAMIACIIIWYSTEESALEYAAASVPFLYMIPFIWQNYFYYQYCVDFGIWKNGQNGLKRHFGTYVQDQQLQIQQVQNQRIQNQININNHNNQALPQENQPIY